jgi:hypothetical protein
LVPCILFAVSALLAWSELNFGTPGEQTAAGRVAGSLGYAFSPLLVSLLAAGLITRLRRVPGQPSPFRSNLNWTWSIVLGMLVLSHILDLVSH